MKTVKELIKVLNEIADITQDDNTQIFVCNTTLKDYDLTFDSKTKLWKANIRLVSKDYYD